MKKRRIRRILIAALVLAGLAFIGTSWFVGSTLVAPANHPVGPPPNGFHIESVAIPSGSGSTPAAWFVPCDGATATVILLHPIRSDRRAMLGRAELLRDTGYSTLLVDLQGHGESPGENITGGFRERLDVVASVDFSRPTVSLDTLQWFALMNTGGVYVWEAAASWISAGRPKADRRRSTARAWSILLATQDGGRDAPLARR